MTVERDKIIEIAEAYTAAWNSGSPEAVAEFYAVDGWIVINRGDPWKGRARVAEMAAGFFVDVPDLALVCDSVRSAGDHVVYCWTFTGNHAATRKPLQVSGWEEWDLNTDLKVQASHGWFDADDYARQVAAELTLMTEAAPQRDHSLRELFNALRYVIRYGIAGVPCRTTFRPWAAVYQQPQRWLASGCFETLAQDLRAVLRLAGGPAPDPTAAIIDSPTLRSTPEAAPAPAMTAPSASAARRCT